MKSEFPNSFIFSQYINNKIIIQIRYIFPPINNSGNILFMFLNLVVLLFWLPLYCPFVMRDSKNYTAPCCYCFKRCFCIFFNYFNMVEKNTLSDHHLQCNTKLIWDKVVYKTGLSWVPWQQMTILLITLLSTANVLRLLIKLPDWDKMHHQLLFSYNERIQLDNACLGYLLKYDIDTCTQQ